MKFDLSTLIIILPVFLVLYQAVGLILERRRRSGWARIHGGQKPATSWVDMGGQLGFNRWLLKKTGLRDSLEVLLIRSGNPFNWSVERLLFLKELSVLVVLAWLWQVGMITNPIAVIIGVFVGFKALDFHLAMKEGARREQIQQNLPGYIDLLALTLESGLDLMVASERIVDKMKSNALRDELQALLQESKLGTARKEALQHLAYRANLPDVSSLTSIIIQSEELGTSLAVVLRAYAEDMRAKRILRAEEMAGKAPVKLLFPMMVFFFPIVFIVIFGPLALNFMKGAK